MNEFAVTAATAGLQLASGYRQTPARKPALAQAILQAVKRNEQRYDEDLIELLRNHAGVNNTVLNSGLTHLSVLVRVLQDELKKLDRFVKIFRHDRHPRYLRLHSVDRFRILRVARSHLHDSVSDVHITLCTKHVNDSLQRGSRKCAGRRLQTTCASRPPT